VALALVDRVAARGVAAGEGRPGRPLTNKRPGPRGPGHFPTPRRSSHDDLAVSTGGPAPGFRDKFGEIVDQRRGADFQVLKTRDLVNRLNQPGMPFGWTVNPYRGCEVGCAYCYARPTHEYLGQSDPESFERLIFVKRGDRGRLDRRLRAARASGREVAIGTATDPYQPAEGRFATTRTVLEAIGEVGGLRVSVTTKAAAVTRDLALLRAVASRCDLVVNVSLISLDADLLRRLEPRAPRPDLRVDALRQIAAAGVRTRLFVMPILPYLTDDEPGLRQLIRSARAAGAAEAISNVLFLRGSTKPLFLEWIAREAWWLSERYEALYRGSAYAPREYRSMMEQLVARLAREEGFPARTREERVRDEAPARPRQLVLTW
jgi:DNA repair photolyase